MEKPLSRSRAQELRWEKVRSHPELDIVRRQKISSTIRAANRRGPSASGWRGGRGYTREGYVYVWSPDHPRANCHGRVLEHRLVMEKLLGRFLEPWEVVHHKNKVRDDNRPDNLELLTWSDHSKFVPQFVKSLWPDGLYQME